MNEHTDLFPQRGPARRSLKIFAGQAQLLWMPAGAELRCLRGTAEIRGAAEFERGHAPPARLAPHAAWRSPHGAWVCVEAGAREVTCQITEAALDAAAPERMPGTGQAWHPQKSRRWRDALRRLGIALRRGALFFRRARHAG